MTQKLQEKKHFVDTSKWFLCISGRCLVCTCDNVSVNIFLNQKVPALVINLENYQVRLKIHLFHLNYQILLYLSKAALIC